MTKLVFWHGWGMSPDVWTDFMKDLREVLPGDTVYEAVPLPGYAGTGLPDGDSLSSWADALMEGMPEPIVLCGWSMGAVLALSAACRYPERIERLVLFGATPCFVERHGWQAGMSQESARHFRDGVRADPVATLRRFVALFNRQDKQARAIVRRLSGLDIPPSPVLDAGLDFLDRADFRSLVPHIRQKVLLVHGENDPLMPPDAALWLAENLPDAALEILPDVAHAPFLSDSRQCARFVGAFLGD